MGVKEVTVPSSSAMLLRHLGVQLVSNVDVGGRASNMRRKHASGRRHRRGTSRELLHGSHRLRGHVGGTMGVRVPTVQLLGLHGMLKSMTRRLHREKKRSGRVAVGLGKREKRGPGVEVRAMGHRRAATWSAAWANAL